jgi:hypothetical protein
MEKKMKFERTKKLFYGLTAAAGILASGATLRAAEVAQNSTAPVTMTVTANVASNKRMPQINREDVIVRQGKSRLEIADWAPARGNRAGLELFILIDESADSRISLQYDDLREFINAQPASTQVGIGYMRNGTVQIAQDLTPNHALAAQALRMPFGNPGAYGSPYLSVTDLMKSWPVAENRREVIMVADGIGRERYHHSWRRGYVSDPDVDTASAVAQKTGTNIFNIYAPGAARYHRTYWEGANGQMNMTRLSNSTGGASFYLGLHSPVSLRPYFQQLQTIFDNQYLLSFYPKSGKKSGLQSISLSTEVAGVDFSAHDAVWVAGNK